jgi:outer membrane lipoprotein SlyB
MAALQLLGIAGYSASLRLALYHHKRTLHAVQLIFLGSIQWPDTKIAAIGQSIGSGLGGMLENLIGQHGQSNVQGAMSNNIMGSLVGQLSQAIQSHPGIPQFTRGEMCQALSQLNRAAQLSLQHRIVSRILTMRWMA